MSKYTFKSVISVPLPGILVLLLISLTLVTVSPPLISAQEPTDFSATVVGGSPGGIATAKEPDLGIQSVIVPDERVQIGNTTTLPWRAIAQLQVTYPSYSGPCTGWFIGPHTVMTAGHCVYDSDYGGWATSIKVTPGKNSASEPFGSQTVSTSALRSVTGWVNNGLPDHDYGAIILPNDNLGNNVGWFFNYGYFSDQFLSNVSNANVAGYPGDKPAGTLWHDNDPISSITAGKINYAVDTFYGNSGSAVWLLGDYRVIAIHTNGVGHSSCAQGKNCGTRITLNMAQKFQEWGAPPPCLSHPQGDVTGDGFVNDDDLSLLIDDYFKVGPEIVNNTDFNCDDSVDADDLGILIDHYLQGVGGTQQEQTSTIDIQATPAITLGLSSLIITGSQIVSIPVTISSMNAPVNIVDVVIDVGDNTELISNPAILKGNKFSNWSIALEPIIENNQIKFSLFTFVEGDRYQGGTTVLVSLLLDTQAVTNQKIVPLSFNTTGSPRTKIKTKIGSNPTADTVLTTNNGTIILTPSNFAVFLPLIVKGF